MGKECKDCWHNYHCSMPQEGYDFDPDTCPYNPDNEKKEEKEYVYIIKRYVTTWDGCNGADTSEDYLNWIFKTKAKADAKCEELNNRTSNHGLGYRRRYEVVKEELL